MKTALIFWFFWIKPKVKKPQAKNMDKVIGNSIILFRQTQVNYALEILNGIFHFRLCVLSKALKTENCLSTNQELTKKREEEEIIKKKETATASFFGLLLNEYKGVKK